MLWLSLVIVQAYAGVSSGVPAAIQWAYVRQGFRLSLDELFRLLAGL